jgi:hypothetical protein
MAWGRQNAAKFSQCKGGKSLEPDGLNLSIWMYDTYTCSVSKNCSEAFQGPMPGTKANVGRMNLLISMQHLEEYHGCRYDLPFPCIRGNAMDLGASFQ